MDPLDNLIVQLRRLGTNEDVLTAVAAATDVNAGAELAVSMGVPPDVVAGIMAGEIAVGEDGTPVTQAPLAPPPISPFPTVDTAAQVEGMDPDFAAFLAASGALDGQDEVPEQPFIGLSGFGSPNPLGVLRSLDEPTGAPPTGVQQALNIGFGRGVQPTVPATGPRFVPPTYRVGDEFELFVGLAPEALAGIQLEMMEAGLLAPGEFAAGFWDVPSAAAMQEVMGYSNLTGRVYGESLQFLKEVHRARLATDPSAAQSGTSGLGGRVFQLPDMASIRQAVKREFRSQLGRDPSEAELALFANEMMADARAGIDQAISTDEAGNREVTDEELLFDLVGRTELTFQDLQDLERVAKGNLGGVEETTEFPEGRRALSGEGIERTFAAREPRGETDLNVLARTERGRRLLAALGIDPDDPTPRFADEGGGGGARVVSAIDPEARFREAFERAFAGEIQRGERVTQTAEQRNLIMRSILGLDGAFNG